MFWQKGKNEEQKTEYHYFLGDLRISWRLWLWVLIAVSSLSLILLYVFYEMGKMDELAAGIEVETVEMNLLKDFSSGIKDATMDMHDFVEGGEEKDARGYEDAISNLEGYYLGLLNLYSEGNEKEKVILSDIKNGFKNYKEFGESLLAEYRENSSTSSVDSYADTEVLEEREDELARLIEEWYVYAFGEVNNFRKDFLETRDLIRSILLVFMAVVFLGSLSFGSLFISSITRPLNRLLAVSRNVSSGNLRARVDISNKDEIGEVGRSFDDMTEKMNGINQNLEKEIARRTKELGARIKEYEKLNQSMVGRELKMVELKRELLEEKKKKNHG